MNSYSDLDWDEAWEYQPGFTVELASRPGVSHKISSYDPMMVPPIWLVDDPKPRYPHELKVVSCVTTRACQLAPQTAAPRLQMCFG
jgi:hypothetical protein